MMKSDAIAVRSKQDAFAAGQEDRILNYFIPSVPSAGCNVAVCDLLRTETPGTYFGFLRSL